MKSLILVFPRIFNRLRVLLVSLVLATMAISPLASADCVSPPSDLVSWWQGERNALDFFGGNHGHFVNDASTAGGINGDALSFDGSGDLVIISNAPNLQLQSLTIEGWVKRSSPTVASSGSGNVGVIFGYGNGGYIFYMDGSGSLYFGKLGEFAVVSSVITVSDTNYHHVAVTRTGETAVFYVDGVASVAPPYNPLFEFNTDAAIGARSDNFDNSFFGRIDELCIYSRALSEFEIQSIFLAGGEGKCQPAIAPQIISHPADVAVETGGSTTLMVQAMGATPLSYQWLLDGNNLHGATNTSLSLYGISPASVGGYSVLVTNTYGSTMSTTGVLSLLPTPPCTAWPTGMVSWWRGESNAFDHFGINNGYPTGNVAYAPGRVGAGFSMDGLGDMILVANQPSLRLQNLTIETWVRRGSSTVASFGSGGNAVLFGYGNGGYISYLDGSGRVFFGRLGSVAVQSAWQIADTKPHHLAVTKSNTVVTFYLDGTNISSVSYGQSFVFNTPVGMGARPDNLDNSFLGVIDEMTIYNRGLSTAEIQALHLAGVSGKCAIPLPPSVTAQPTNRTVKAGETVSFIAGVSGTPPFALQWLRNDTTLDGATNVSLTFTNVQPSQAGSYQLRLTNELGTAQSANAALKVIVVSAYGNGVPLTNSSYAFNGLVAIQLQNAYTGGPMFYTLDGSQPTFASTPYSGSFVVSNNIVLRALGYRADFLESGELDPITILLPPAYPLTVSSSGGGSVNVSPSSGPYISNTLITVTGTPAAGWQFMQWLGDATGNTPIIGVTMNRPKTVHAVFGTILNTTAAGGGMVQLSPSGGVYPYGATVQLTAIPNTGNQFALWGNAASGNVNPLSFTMTNANPTVSSLFAPVAGGQVALTLAPVGAGQVIANPRANAYSTGTSVTITATPSAGQSFLGWGGDATGDQNPLSVTMNQSKLIYANFTAKPRLIGEPLPEGFRISLSGDFFAVYQLESSTNLTVWDTLAALTNTIGTVQYTDPTSVNGPQRYYRALRLP